MQEKSYKSLLRADLISVSLFFFCALNIAIQYRVEWIPDFLFAELVLTSLTIILPFMIEGIYTEKKRLSLPIIHVMNIKDPFLTSRMITKYEKPGKWNYFLILFLGTGISFYAFYSIHLSNTVILWTRLLPEIFFEFWLYGILCGYGFLVGLYLHSFKFLLWTRFNEEKIHDAEHLIDGGDKIFYWPQREIKKIYESYASILFYAVIFYGCFVASILVTPAGDYIILKTSIGRYWVIPPAAIILLFFISFILRMDRITSKWRQLSLEKMNLLIESRMNSSLRKYSKDNSDEIDKIIEWRDKLIPREINSSNIFGWSRALVVFSFISSPSISALLPDLLPEGLKEGHFLDLIIKVFQQG